MDSLLLSNYPEDDNNSSLFEKMIEKNNVYMFYFFVSKYPPFLNSSNSLQKWLFKTLESNINEKMSLLLLDLYCDNIDYNVTKYVDDVEVPIICYAAMHNKIRVVRWLLLRGADANLHCTNGKSLLSILIEFEQTNLVELLFEHYNVSLNETDDKGVSIIFEILERKLYTLSNYMLNEGVNIDCRNAEGMSLLELVVSKNLFLHTNFVLGNGGGSVMYNDYKLFHKLIHIAIDNGSTLIANRLILNYYAAFIQKVWRRKRNDDASNCT